MAGRLYGVSDTGIWNILLNEVLDYFSRYVLACLIRASLAADDLMDAIEMAKQEGAEHIRRRLFPEK